MQTAGAVVHVSLAVLARRPGRTLGLALAVAAALTVVLILEGFLAGLLEQASGIVLQRGGDLIAIQSGVTSFLASRSKLPQLSREGVEAIPGVRSAEPIALLPATFEHVGRKSPVFLLVHDRGGGPSRIVAGRAAGAPREVVVDRGLAAMYGLGIGDPIVISDYEFDIAGLSAGEAALFTALIFVSYDDLIDFYFSSDVVGDLSSLPLLSFLLIDLDDGIDPISVRGALEEAVPSADFLLPAELAASDVETSRAMLGPVLGVLIAMSYLICLMVIAMISYASARARTRLYGVLLALGFRGRDLAVGLTVESLGLTALAVPLAVGLAWLVATLVEQQAPLYRVSVVEVLPIVRTALVSFVLAVLGAALACGPVVRLGPVEAFRR